MDQSVKSVNKYLLDYLLKCHDLAHSRGDGLQRDLLDECRCQIVRNIGFVLCGVYAADKAYPNMSESILTSYVVDQRVSFDLLRQLMVEFLKNEDLLNSRFAMVLMEHFFNVLWAIRELDIFMFM